MSDASVGRVLARKVRRRANALYKKLHPPFVIVPFDEAFPTARKLHRTAPRCVETPELMDFPLWPEIEHLKSKTYQVPEDYTTTLSNALYYARHNVLMADKRRVVAESVDVPKLVRVPAHNKAVEFIPGVSTFIRSSCSIYYHVLIEQLPRILALDVPPYSDLPEIKLLCPRGPKALELFYLSKLAPGNIRVFPVDRNRLYRVEKLIFTPLKTRKSAGYIPEPYLSRYRERILPKRPSKRNLRIYMSRANQSIRRVENEEELMDALRPLGFVCILPDDLSLEDEINTFYDAEMVVGPSGSGFANILFCNNIKVLEIIPTWFAESHFYFLCKSLGHDYGFVCGHMEDRYPDSFIVDVDAVINRLRKMGIS